MLNPYSLLPLPVLGGLRSARPAKAKPVESVITLDDVAGVMSECWAMPVMLAAALKETLPELVGCKAEDARRRLGVLASAGSGAQPSGSIGVLRIFGMIFPRGGLASKLGLATPERVAELFRSLLNNPNVSAIVLDVDSPGGVVAGLTEVTREIYQARGQKRIASVANHLAASAAYWLASAADEFMASPSSELGAIGVFALHEDISRANEKAGRKVSLMSAGKHKTDGNPWEPLSADARAGIQGRVSAYYSMFASDVARNRGVSVATVRDGFGQGRLVGAHDAVRLGIADRVATLDETLARLSRPVAGQGHRAQGQTSINSDTDFRRRRARLLWNSVDWDHHELLMAEVSMMDARTLARAQRALVFCQRDLALTHSLELHWFAADAKRYTLGMFLRSRPDEIWLSDKLTAANVARTVAHEARHAWQQQTLPADDFRFTAAPEAYRWRESDCESYVARAIGAGL